MNRTDTDYKKIFSDNVQVIFVLNHSTRYSLLNEWNEPDRTLTKIKQESFTPSENESLTSQSDDN